MKTKISSGISDHTCEVPADWEAIAQANSRALDEDRAARKSDTVKLKSIEAKNATCSATCEVPEKYAAALIATGKWELVPQNVYTVSSVSSKDTSEHRGCE